MITAIEKAKVKQKRKIGCADMNKRDTCKQGGQGSEGFQSMSYAAKNIECAAILCDMDMNLYIKYICIPGWHIYIYSSTFVVKNVFPLSTGNLFNILNK